MYIYSIIYIYTLYIYDIDICMMVTHMFTFCHIFGAAIFSCRQGDWSIFWAMP